jgi:hypothetical protein
MHCCWELMKSVGRHSSLSLLFVMKLMVWHFVSTTLTRLDMTYDCILCHVILKLLWRFLCNFVNMRLLKTVTGSLEVRVIKNGCILPVRLLLALEFYHLQSYAEVSTPSQGLCTLLNISSRNWNVYSWRFEWFDYREQMWTRRSHCQNFNRKKLVLCLIRWVVLIHGVLRVPILRLQIWFRV